MEFNKKQTEITKEQPTILSYIKSKQRKTSNNVKLERNTRVLKCSPAKHL